MCKVGGVDYEEIDLSSLAKTLSGSTMLQVKLQDNSNPNLAKNLLKMIIQNPVELINHPRSTYVVQTLIKALSREDLLLLTGVVEKHFLKVSENKCGTHVVQTLLSNQYQEVVQVNTGLYLSGQINGFRSPA